MPTRTDQDTARYCRFCYRTNKRLSNIVKATDYYTGERLYECADIRDCIHACEKAS